MNLLTIRKIKIYNWILLLILVSVFSCDDFFVEDISGLQIHLKTPTTGYRTEDKNISFRWDNIPKAVSYNLEVVTPGFSLDHKLVFEKSLNSAKFDTTLSVGDYEWRVNAINSASETGFVSSSFTILPPFNISSKIVTLTLPQDQAICKDRNVDFKWEALSGSSYYSLKIKKTNWIGDSIVVTRLNSTNYSFRLDDGVYSWGVAAVDTLTKKKTDYTIRSFIIDQNPPSSPLLTSPANQDTISNAIVGFKWRKTEPNASYTIEIYGDIDLKNKLQEKTISDTLTYINLEKSGNYYWRVNSKDQYGNVSGFSPVSIFYIFFPLDIRAKTVQLMSPADGSLITEKKVTFWWNILEGATKYNLQIVSPSFVNPTKVIYDQWTSSNSVAVNLDAGNYQWRVKAVNSDNQTGYSQYSFSIYNTDLSTQKTTLISPLYGAQINTTNLKLSWAKINDNATYQLVIKKDSWESGITVLDLKTNQTETLTSLSDGNYYWGIKAIDPVNNSESEFSIRKFEVSVKLNLSGSKVTLLSPADKSMLIDKKVTLWWNPLSGADKYNLQIVSPSFTAPTKLIYDQWITSNSLSLDLDAGNYEWRVKAANSISETSFSQFALSVYINDLSSQKVSLTNPLYGEQTNLSSIKFIWERLGVNVTYHLLIKKDSWETGNIFQEINTENTEVLLPLSEGDFYWGVKAIDIRNNSETTYSVRKLIIDLTSPESPKLLAPANNFLTTDFLINFLWEPSDATDTKLTYTLEMFQVNANSTIQLPSKTTQLKSIGYNFDSIGKYKWRMYATDAFGNKSAYSEFRFFDLK